MRYSILISVLVFLAVSCINNPKTDDTSPKNGELILDQELVSKINSSPSSLSIGNAKYLAESYAWKDFMPPVEPPVKLNSNNTLIRKDGAEIQNIKIIQLYIVKGNEIWIPDNVEVRQNQGSPEKLHIVSHGGPTWSIGTNVNIGLKIKNQKTGEVLLFSVSGVPIAETQ